MTKNADGSEEPHYPLARSLYSFKVLKECPIILVLLLQIHRKFVNETVEELVPLIVKALALQPAFQLQAHKEAAAAGDVFVGVSPAIKNRSAYVEFKAMQIKTLSFVAYILKNFMGTLKAHQQAVADSVVMLMKDCPPEAPGIRKELLVATRHLWASDFRTSFVPHIDILLNEKVLVGTGVTSREALRQVLSIAQFLGVIVNADSLVRHF